MKTCEIEEIVNKFIDNNVAFLLMSVVDDGDGDYDQCYCLGSKSVPTKKVLEITIGNIVLQMFDDGNKLDDVKASIESLIDEAYDFHNENKTLS